MVEFIMMLPTSFVLTLAIVFAVLQPNAAGACGQTSDCLVSDGRYRIALPAPDSNDRPHPALVYLHGYQGTPAGAMAFQALRDTASDLGVALIAPAGKNRSWGLPDAFDERRDDIAFIDTVIEDATDRFDIDRERIVISGFSLGASMTWYIACARGDAYAGYIAIAGAFWEPYVEDCHDPLPTLHHVHGLNDTTIPLEGRQLSMATQGDTRRSFALLRSFSDCRADLEGQTAVNLLSCTRQACGGTVQELCLHDGGHSVRPIWIARAWRLIAARQGW